MTANKTIYLIRHGQTDYNLKGIVQGSGIDSDLNETGRKQAQAFYNAYNHLTFDHIYTSQLKRTHQSVEPFIKRGHSWTQMHELNEINWGIFEGVVPTPEAKNVFNQMVASWRNGDLAKAIEGGETPLEMFERQRRGWQQIKQSSHKNILICMHGRAMRSFLSLVLDTPLQEMDQYPHTNLGVYQVEVNAGSSILHLKNDTRHFENIDLF